jgi:hypothetical protein
MLKKKRVITVHSNWHGGNKTVSHNVLHIFFSPGDNKNAETKECSIRRMKRSSCIVLYWEKSGMRGFASPSVILRANGKFMKGSDIIISWQWH